MFAQGVEQPPAPAPTPAVTAASGLPFDFDWLQGEAKRLAAGDHEPPEPKLPKALAELGYDAYRDIRFKPERQVWAGEGRGFTLDFFHPGAIYKTPVRIDLVQDGVAREVPFSTDLFTYGSTFDEPPDGKGLAFSGFRVRYPINRPDVLDEFLVFQGASYFRGIGRNQLYGLSARGLTLHTAEPQGEEFPAFTRFWIETPEKNATSLRFWALLESRSVTGAYAFTARPGDETVVEVEATIYPRVGVASYGLAPLTSMFFFDPSNRAHVDDFREAVHDSGGLQMVTGADVRIWRPLANPPGLQVSAFEDSSPKGFGLVQRRRSFTDYQDAEARYEKRPSAWVEPVGDWGKGAVVLVEIPVTSEFNDNIVAFWRPDAPLVAGEPRSFAYRLRFCERPPDDTPLARVAVTRCGLASNPDHRLFVIDYDPGADVEGDVAVDADCSAGKLVHVGVQRLPGTDRRRVTLEFDPAGAELAEFRVVLTKGGEPCSETWLYRWTR